MEFESVVVMHSMQQDISASKFCDLITQDRFDNIVDVRYVYNLFLSDN